MANLRHALRVRTVVPGTVSPHNLLGPETRDRDLNATKHQGANMNVSRDSTTNSHIPHFFILLYCCSTTGSAKVGVITKSYYDDDVQ